MQVSGYVLPASRACTRCHITIANGLLSLKEYLYNDVDVEYREIALYYSYNPLSVCSVVI